MMKKVYIVDDDQSVIAALQIFFAQKTILLKPLHRLQNS